ncbi:MAG: GlsB/YeaQ/YmgE family stress response membrane protein [Pseudomonadota bacterium]
MDFESIQQGFQNILDGLGVEVTQQEILVCSGIGVVAGWLASQIVGGKGGIIRYVLAGILGSFLGPVVLEFFSLSLPEFGMPIVNDIAEATVGATVIVLVARIIG